MQTDSSNNTDGKRSLEDGGEPPKKKTKLTVNVCKTATKKKKVAIMCCYAGTNYRGSWWQKEEKYNNTIEKELLYALVKVGGFQHQANVDAILEGDLRKVSFQRTSRTDKGVSAAVAVFSVKLCLIGTMDEMKDKINELLPSDIRVLAIQRTLKSFDSHKCCDSRKYEYLCPSFVFDQKADMQHLDTFRLADDKQALMKELLEIYSSGTRNYWNFTQRISYGDPKAKRHMKSILIVGTFEASGMEWVRFSFHGQSFMKHQIRKMLGLVVMCVRGCWEKEQFMKAFESERLVSPMVPGEGLLLIAPMFNGYNKKCKKLKRSDEELDTEKYAKENTKLANSLIYPAIYSANKVWKDWIVFADNFDPDLHKEESTKEIST